MAAILTAAGWLLIVSLPLTGQAEVRPAPAREPLRQNRDSVGYVVNRSPLSYPPEAVQKRIEGVVVVELTFNVRGEIVDSRVLSGPEELRQAGLQTALQGKYPIDTARTLQVVVDFKLPAGQRNAGTAAPGARSGRGALPQPGLATTSTAEMDALPQLSGSVVDASRNLMPGVSITAKNEGTGAVAVALTDAKGEYKFSALAPGPYSLTAEFPGFQTMKYSKAPIAFSQQVRLNFTLRPEVASAPTPATAEPAASRVRIGANVAAGNLALQVKPEYPPDAKANGIQGQVLLEADINREGRVERVSVISGPPALTQAAIDAVKQWVYRPILLNGQPVDAVTTVSVTFQPSQN